MKSLTMQQGGDRYLRRGIKVKVRKVTKYFTAVAAEVLLDGFQWEHDRTVDFLERFYDQYVAMYQSYLKIQDYAPTLREDYGYEVELRNKAEKPDATPVSKLEQRMTDTALLWIAQVMALTLLDKFGWDTTAITRFMRNIDEAIPKFIDGGGDYEARIQKLREKYGLDIHKHIKMGGETL
ncbi:MAG: hypothetical protein IKR49_02345 [Clostridia bacterium]|nr:hypothetical protein [Clostridia bacterium]